MSAPHTMSDPTAKTRAYKRSHVPMTNAGASTSSILTQYMVKAYHERK